MNHSISEIKKLGKQNMNLQWGASLLILVIYAALIACGNAIPVLGAIVVSGALTYGLTYVYYHASHGENINYWDIFKGFEGNFGENFLANVLVGVFTTLWTLLFVIPGIVKSYAYSMTFYLLVREPELTATEAITRSCEITKGYKMKLFMFDLSFLGWSILEAITAGILSVYVAPYRKHSKFVLFNEIYEAKTNTEINDEEVVEPVTENKKTYAGIDPSLIVDVEPEEKNENID